MSYQFDAITAEQITAEINRAGGDQVDLADVEAAIEAGNLAHEGRVDFLRFIAWLMTSS